MNMLNPFSTCFIEPGKLDFVNLDLNPFKLAERLHNDQRSFQIVGPHGSGKTTLSIEIAKHLSAHSFRCHWMTLRRENFFSTPVVKHEQYLPSAQEFDPKRQLFFVDGIETIGFLPRCLALRSFRNQNQQVVVTAHRRLLGLPILATTRTSLELFNALVERLVPGLDESWLPKIATAYEQSQGDFREAFFLLYDRWNECKDPTSQA